MRLSNALIECDYATTDITSRGYYGIFAKNQHFCRSDAMDRLFGAKSALFASEVETLMHFLLSCVRCRNAYALATGSAR